jgi:predicted amidophosphoribosyltransferase
MEAVLESGSRQQVLSLVETYVNAPDQADLSANESDPEEEQEKQGTPTKLVKKQESKATSETSSILQPQDSSLTDDLVQKTDAQLRREFLAQVKEKAGTETDERLARMLAKAKFDNDSDIVKIVNAEIDKRFEGTREKQRKCLIEVCYSGLQRRGYSSSQESVSRFLHRQRLTHKAGVALAMLHLAMNEGGEKMEGGKRVLTKAHVVQRLLEKAYEAIKEQEPKND